MTKSATINKFVREHIAVRFPDFHLVRRRDLLRICRPLLHGIVFESPGAGEYFYVTCFVQFLTERLDHLAIGFGERLLRPDEPGQSFWVEPPNEEDKLLEAMHRSQFSPFNLQPNCENIIELAETTDHGAHTYFGLATCAILENDVVRAREFLNKSRKETGPPEYEWRQRLLNEIAELEEGLKDLQSTQIKLMRWVEETIRMLGLQKYG